MWLVIELEVDEGCRDRQDMDLKIIGKSRSQSSLWDDSNCFQFGIEAQEDNRIRCLSSSIKLFDTCHLYKVLIFNILLNGQRAINNEQLLITV